MANIYGANKPSIAGMQDFQKDIRSGDPRTILPYVNQGGGMPTGAGGMPTGAGGMPTGAGGMPPATGGMPPGGLPSQVKGPTPVPTFVPEENELEKANKVTLKETLAPLKIPIVEHLAARAGIDVDDIVNEMLGYAEMDADDTLTVANSGGGIMELAAGGEFSGRVPGIGHGMQDNVRMPIAEGPQQVGTLAVSPSEYVVDSYTMAALGNGNPDAGANVMDQVVENVRQRAYGNREQPNEIDGLKALRPMIERV